MASWVCGVDIRRPAGREHAGHTQARQRGLFRFLRSLKLWNVQEIGKPLQLKDAWELLHRVLSSSTVPSISMLLSREFLDRIALPRG